MSYKFSNVRLLVTDFPGCFRFYRDILGFKPGYGTENDTYALFDTGPIQIELFKRELMAQVIGAGDKPLSANAQDGVLLSFQVENVDTAVRDLQAKGVKLVHPPTDRSEWGVRAAHFRDPAGTLLEFWHRLPTAS